MFDNLACHFRPIVITKEDVFLFGFYCFTYQIFSLINPVVSSPHEIIFFNLFVIVILL